MGLSEQDREALRAHWLGEALPSELERLLAYVPRSKSRRARHLAAREYLGTLSEESARRTRRLVLAFAPSAVGVLASLMQQEESKDLARRAAVDLMRLYWDFREEERRSEAAASVSVERLLVESLTDEQVETLLGILADAGAGSCAGGVAALPGVAAGERGDEGEEAAEEE